MPRLTEEELAVLMRLLQDEPYRDVSPVVYPVVRDRHVEHLGWVTQRYLRYEATPGYVTLGDTYAQVIEFSGIPDSIELWVLDQNCLIQFLNEVGGSNEPIQVNANNFYEPGISYRSVVARNATAGLNARLQVVAKWVYR